MLSCIPYFANFQIEFEYRNIFSSLHHLTDLSIIFHIKEISMKFIGERSKRYFDKICMNAMVWLFFFGELIIAYAICLLWWCRWLNDIMMECKKNAKKFLVSFSMKNKSCFLKFSLSSPQTIAYQFAAIII